MPKEKLKTPYKPGSILWCLAPALHHERLGWCWSRNHLYSSVVSVVFPASNQSGYQLFLDVKNRAWSGKFEILHATLNTPGPWHSQHQRHIMNWARLTLVDMFKLRGRLSRIRDNGNIVTRTIVTNSWRKRIRQKDWLQLLATPRHACHSCQGSCRRVVETKELLDRLFRDISTVAWQCYDREKRLNAWWRPALESRSSGLVSHKNERLCSGTLF